MRFPLLSNTFAIHSPERNVRAVLYLANASSPAVRAAMTRGELGQMCTPAEGRAPLDGVTWAADNGCFGRGFPGEQRWFAWLRRHAEHADRCLWATAPDVFLPELGRGDALATLERSWHWLPEIRYLGYRAALVAQDGLEEFDVPYEAFDVLFLGGSTEWKLGPHAAALATEAQARGLTVHMGRCNSGRRLTYATELGCASADGTYLTFAPDQNLQRLRRWTTPTAA